MLSVLSELLHHPDQLQRLQGVELAHALGPEAVDALIDTFRDGQGGLWPPADGWNQELLQLVTARGRLADWSGNIRHISAACADIDALLPAIVQAFPRLESLDVSWSPITDLSPLTALQHLRNLRLCGCPSVTDLQPLTALSLTSLDISMMSPPDLSPIPNLQTVQSLTARDMRGVISLPVLPPHLVALWLGESTIEGDLPLRRVPLQSLSIARVECLPPQQSLPDLHTLHLATGMPHQLKGWPVRRLHLRSQPERGALAHMHGLQHLQIEQGHHLRDVPPDLRTLDARQSVGLPSAWPYKIQPSARLLRVASLPLSHPFFPVWGVAARQWWESGSRWMLVPTDPPEVHARRILNMHRTFGHGLTTVRQMMELLAQEQLIALRHQQAVDLQMQFQTVGLSTRCVLWNGML